MAEQQQAYRGLHPEDVKAAVRKKFGTITRFHKENGLPSTGLHDVIRGRASKRVEDAIDKVLSEAGYDSTKMERSSAAA